METLLLIALVVALFFATLGWLLSGKQVPPFFATFVVLFLTSFFLQEKAEKQLLSTNKVRLEQWSANQCVSPKEVARSVFIAQGAAFSGHGTAFLLEGDVVVTNRHVADGISSQGYFTDVKGNLQTGRLVHRADEATSPDLAFYALDSETTQERPALTLANAKPVSGESLLVVGQTSGRDWFNTSVVMMTAYNHVNDGDSLLTAIAKNIYILSLKILNPEVFVDGGAVANPLYALQGDIGSGNSGSPVVNCAGEVAGVVYGGTLLYFFEEEITGAAVTLDGLKAELEKLPKNQPEDLT